MEAALAKLDSLRVKDEEKEYENDTMGGNCHPQFGKYKSVLLNLIRGNNNYKW